MSVAAAAAVLLLGYSPVIGDEGSSPICFGSLIYKDVDSARFHNPQAASVPIYCSPTQEVAIDNKPTDPEVTTVHNLTDLDGIEGLLTPDSFHHVRRIAFFDHDRRVQIKVFQPCGPGGKLTDIRVCPGFNQEGSGAAEVLDYDFEAGGNQTGVHWSIRNQADLVHDQHGQFDAYSRSGLQLSRVRSLFGDSDCPFTVLNRAPQEVSLSNESDKLQDANDYEQAVVFDERSILSRFYLALALILGGCAGAFWSVLNFNEKRPLRSSGLIGLSCVGFMAGMAVWCAYGLTA